MEGIKSDFDVLIGGITYTKSPIRNRSITLQGKLAQLLPVEVQHTQVTLGFHSRCAVTAHDAQSLCIQAFLEWNPSDALVTAFQLATVERVFLAVLRHKSQQAFAGKFGPSQKMYVWG